MTITDTDLSILEALDFSPPCEFSRHGSPGYGTEDEPATMMVLICFPCCGRAPTWRLFCDGCWNRRAQAPAWRHMECDGRTTNFKDTYLQIVRL